MPGVCSKSQNMMQSVKTPGYSGMCGEIFPPRFRFSLGMRTLIPWGFVWSMQLLLSTTLLFLPCRPSHPSLTEIAVSLPSHRCRGSTAFSNAGMSCLCSDTRPQCLGKSPISLLAWNVRMTWPAHTSVWNGLSQSAGQLSDFSWWSGDAREMANAGRWAWWKGKWLRSAIVTSCRMCWGGCSLCCWEQSLCRSGCSGLCCPAHQPFHSHSGAGTWGCTAWSSSYLCWGAWRGGELPCLNEVGYLPAESSGEESPPPKLGSLLLRRDTSIITEQQDKQRGNKLL